MPWSPTSFKKKHNKSLTGSEAGEASRQANAMLKAGVPEGVAIATANKHVNQMRAKAKRKRS